MPLQLFSGVWQAMLENFGFFLSTSSFKMLLVCKRPDKVEIILGLICELQLASPKVLLWEKVDVPGGGRFVFEATLPDHVQVVRLYENRGRVHLGIGHVMAETVVVTEPEGPIRALYAHVAVSLGEAVPNTADLSTLSASQQRFLDAVIRTLRGESADS